MSKRPAEHEVAALAEKLFIRSTGSRLAAYRASLFPMSNDHLETDAADAFRAAEVFLCERARRATALTDEIFIEVTERRRKIQARVTKKPSRKKGKR